ncbi:hypothetical protein [Nonomuraea rubra]|uniref:hypothetical protein n=1 Tax=Nonomuraea rubra TaxID=46180 RepID=UPI0031E91A00
MRASVEQRLRVEPHGRFGVVPEQLTSFRGRFRRRTLQDLVLVDVEADPFGTRYASDSPVTQYIGVSVNTRRFTERVVFGDHREYVLSAPVEVWDATTLGGVGDPRPDVADRGARGRSRRCTWPRATR